jgi:hypothetical protein
MVKICQTRLLKLNFEIIQKKRIFRFLPKISAGHAWSWNIFFANFQILKPLGCQGWVVIPQNVKKVKITAPYWARCHSRPGLRQRWEWWRHCESTVLSNWAHCHSRPGQWRRWEWWRHCPCTVYLGALSFSSRTMTEMGMMTTLSRPSSTLSWITTENLEKVIEIISSKTVIR